MKRNVILVMFSHVLRYHYLFNDSANMRLLKNDFLNSICQSHQSFNDRGIYVFGNIILVLNTLCESVFIHATKLFEWHCKFARQFYFPHITLDLQWDRFSLEILV